MGYTPQWAITTVGLHGKDVVVEELSSDAVLFNGSSFFVACKCFCCLFSIGEGSNNFVGETGVIGGEGCFNGEAGLCDVRPVVLLLLQLDPSVHFLALAVGHVGPSSCTLNKEFKRCRRELMRRPK